MWKYILVLSFFILQSFTPVIAQLDTIEFILVTSLKEDRLGDTLKIYKFHKNETKQIIVKSFYKNNKLSKVYKYEYQKKCTKNRSNNIEIFKLENELWIYDEEFTDRYIYLKLKKENLNNECALINKLKEDTKKAGVSGILFNAPSDLMNILLKIKDSKVLNGKVQLREVSSSFGDILYPTVAIFSKNEESQEIEIERGNKKYFVKYKNESKKMVPSKAALYRVFPNPITSNSANIENKSSEIVDFILLDLKGNEYMNGKIDPSTIKKIDTSNLANGVYLIKIGKDEPIKIIIQKSL